jgi:hypothetical protein
MLFGTLKRSRKKLGEKRFRAMDNQTQNRVHAYVHVLGTEVCWHIFFHPDYDRRLWILTRSADPADRRRTAGAHGLATLHGLPPVGNFTPP